MSEVKSDSASSQKTSSVHQSITHDSAAKHVTGKAIFVDDLAIPEDTVFVHVGQSEHAHAEIVDMRLDSVSSSPGVVAVLTAKDIPSVNDASPFAGDDPIFASDVVSYVGQSIFAVVATDVGAAVSASKKARVSYKCKPHILKIEDARLKNSTIEAQQTLRLGDAKNALMTTANRISGSGTIGGQDHFYLETQKAIALPQEDGDMHVISSTQAPTEVQQVLARVLGVPHHAVTVEVRRMGGGFGGKETQPAHIAAIAAIAAKVTGRPAKFCLDRDVDMTLTGKRHDFEFGYECGFDDEGRIEALSLELSSRCGHSTDLSPAINDRAMFHADNAYFLKNAEITSNRYRTHTVSNTAFRGFGGPQGIFAIERVIDHAAFSLQKDPIDVRLANLYGAAPRNITPYHQTVEDSVSEQLISTLLIDSDYRVRRAGTRRFNQENEFLKKGIALTPVKFGISFTTTHLNQAGALIHIFRDGSIQLNHGGTEMGQGLNIKVAQVVADEFGVELDRIKITSARTDKVPNTSATAASSGSDLNGMAAKAAAETIRNRLIQFASRTFDCAPEHISFENGFLHVGAQAIEFSELVDQAYLARVSLSSTGFYKTPKIHFDRSKQRGSPFYYFAYGAAVSEVLIDSLTGESRILRVDILHDVGKSLNPAIDLGQIEGGFVQGMGWLTSEELIYDDDGRLLTHAPSTYKIPTSRDRPPIMNIGLWPHGRNKVETIYRSKAVGEPPLMLAISVHSALTDAVCGALNYKVFPNLEAPATPENVLHAIESSA